MNKKVCYILPFAMFFTLVGCNVTPDLPSEKSLVIKTPASKTSFLVGEEFTANGLVITDNNDITISDYNLSLDIGYVFTVEDVGNKSITISKTGYIATSYQIEVSNLKTMRVEQSFKTEYFVGERFDSSDLVVVDIDSGDIITDLNISLANGTLLDEEEDIVITISKEGYVPIEITIHVANSDTLVIAHLPNTMEYLPGEAFTIEGLVVTLNGLEIDDYVLSGEVEVGKTFKIAGSYQYTISKEGYHSVSFTVKVSKTKTMKVATLPAKTTFDVGDAFDSSGLTIVDYVDNPLSGYELSIKNGEIFKCKGERSITVSKEGYASINFDIDVNDKDISGSIYKDLNIYYINDTHGSFAYMSNPYYEAGMSRISSYIKEKKETDASNGNYSLVLSGGDMFQGGLESYETRGSIMIDAMNEISFDAMALGNHEFDWGESYIEKFSDELDCPLLSCNTFHIDGSYPEYLENYTVVEKDNLRIGIIGAAEMNMGSSITGSIADQFNFPNPVSYVKKYSNELRLIKNCDIVLAIFHDGGYETSDGETEPTKFNELTQINSNTGKKYVDAMFFAHDHQEKAGVYNQVPFIESACNAECVGTLSLSLNGNSVYYDVDYYSASNINAYTKCTTNDPAIDALMDKYSEQIGDPDEIIYNFKYSHSRYDFTVIACQALLWYVNEYKPEEFDNTHVYFASHNYQGIRAYVPTGSMTRRLFAKVFPFDNAVCIQESTERQINNMKNSSYYRYAEEDNIVYTGGVTHAVTISFIAEYKYASNYQNSYEAYDITAKQVLEQFLRLKIRTDL